MVKNWKLRRSSPEEERRSDGVHHDVCDPQLYLPTTRQRPNPAPPFTLADSDEIAGTNFLAHGGEGECLSVSFLGCLLALMLDVCSLRGGLFITLQRVLSGSKT